MQTEENVNKVGESFCSWQSPKRTSITETALAT